ncbi:3',5'-cyclic adenosine monophosphate phosphodiesterase CpdA [Dyadobacter sp. CECT 9275]|uniref:3',5'-cyclic adenosine monophosphate phosphodiesterase CpdA n=1 Tax=Dyadobacter helix TaxID=2822344 RepID=A0A916JHX9_9BACT|nr:metallophosphoesterase [Dyadobacter sp. CECT 9275]CAG5012421.1 3',5'-cyclic adenosine monophosphate phosphodiesterase CpdA [Dyadobacter sp. CECT 9275]
MNRTIFFIILTFILVSIDWYIWQGLKLAIRNFTPGTQRLISGFYWTFTALTLLAYVAMQLLPPDYFSRTARTFVFAFIAIPYLSKLLGVVVLLVDDIRRFLQWMVSLVFPSAASVSPDTGEKVIPRSEFLAKTAMVAGAGLMGTFAFGIISGAHDYRIRRVKVALKNLPKAFDGIKIAQLSDIHSGSFFNRTAVKGGVEMLMKEKPDIAFFTGDLVNDKAVEVKDYIDIFNKLKAPLGVHSTLGNHDYGDYVQWASPEIKHRNLEDLKKAHALLGWNLMLDENRAIEVDGEQIGLIGIQNWGAGNFAKYGSLEKAYKGAEDYPVKLLLSHDPSHWQAQVLPGYQDIDIAFAGHTHGMQFGVEIAGLKWSPVQYRYKQWAGLYQEKDQYLYVNRGFGYLGYPGRVGILPEITIMELVKA